MNSTDVINILLAKNLLVKEPKETFEVSNISFHSKQLGPNCLFVCKGNNFKREYLETIQDEIVAYVSQYDYQINKPCILVKDVLKAMAVIASNLYGNPSDKLNIIGITGTKGKTSSLYFLKAILDIYNEKKLAYLGTVEIYDGCSVVPSSLTTPESTTLQKLFKTIIDNGIKDVIMEVSSQALKYDRVYDVKYNYGIFLNISNDHISDVEHPDLKDYFDSKIKLFDASETCIINKNLVSMLPSDFDKEILTFAIDSKATIQATDIEMTDSNSKFNVLYEGEKHSVTLNVPGRFNIENALSVILVALKMGVSMAIINEGLSKVTIPGRMLQVKHKSLPIACIVDYAHNDASFKEIFKYAKEFYPGYKIQAIFGSPGNKAFNRRHELGRVASSFADEVYLVPDDSGYEDPNEINRQIAKVIDIPCFSYSDRKEGIVAAVNNITEPTIIMLLGKGVENTQKINGHLEPYENDYVIIKKLLEEKEF